MCYWVKYTMHSAGNVRGVCVVAHSKVEAYDRAVYEEIPKIEGSAPCSAWVDNVTYNNGKQKHFNTFEGKPY